MWYRDVGRTLILPIHLGMPCDGMPVPFERPEFEDAPLLNAYYADKDSIRHSFAIPGHKNDVSLVGDLISADRPLILNNDMSLPSLGTLRAAEERAARAWGADHARFSVNGSSAANQAAMMSMANHGQKVIISRTLHKSLLFGLINSGAIPVWVRPEYDVLTGLPCGMSAETIERALSDNPDAVAVFIGEPAYVGTYGDISAVARTCHDYGVPLVVDAAWAAHFGFHPDLPLNALAMGADMMVTSAHKTLPAFTQSAILFANGERIDLKRLDKVFDGTQTTSPSVPILASIDAARALMETRGETLLGEALRGVTVAKQRLSSVEGLGLLANLQTDPLKLVLHLNGTGKEGRPIARVLSAHGIEVETANRDILIPQVTLADSYDDIQMLTDLLLEEFSKDTDALPRPVPSSNAWQVDPIMVMSPREAFYSPTEMVPWEIAVGRVSAELVAPYPPGIPVLAPGEKITLEVMDTLREAIKSGVHIAYATDPTLKRLSAIKD